MGFVIYIWLVVSVELTLKWNSVEQVYVVDSTGQVIPLVIGVGIMITITWKLIHEEKVSVNERSISFR